MRALVIGIAALGAGLVALVLFLLARTLLSDRKREFGILKAVGFTTRQLVIQTALSFMPAAALSEGAGLLVWSLGINSIVSLFLRGIGVMRCDFAIPTAEIALCGIGLLAFSFGLICLLSLRIRRENPLDLMREE